MSSKRPLSWTTRLNWFLDATVFLGAIVAALSGLYFLYFVSGGYQAGQNPTYGMTFLLDRVTWDMLHTWGGILMISAVLIHLGIHLDWIGMMSRKMVAILRGTSRGLSTGAKTNLLVDAVIAISFVLCAVSGVYFLFAPTGGFQGGANTGWDPMFLFSRRTWDLIHTWSGVSLIVAAMIHLAIHWRWVTKVSARMLERRRATAPAEISPA